MAHWAWATTGNHVASVKVNIVCQRQPAGFKSTLRVVAADGENATGACWMNSLLVVIGVFMMFYLKPYRKQTEGEPITPSAQKPESVKHQASPVFASAM